MRLFFSILVCIALLNVSSKSQCNPEFIYTSLSIPGVFPTPISIPASPVPFGISNGQQNVLYNQTLTLVVLEDTTLDITPLLSPTLASAINLAGINPVMSLDVNHVQFEVNGLPNGITYICSQNTCQYNSGVDGCILLSGSPIQSGSFSVSVDITINLQIPAINDPIFGNVIVPSMAIDLPSFSAVTYNLVIDGPAVTINNIKFENVLFPNPSSNYSILSLSKKSDVKIYDLLGKKLREYSDVINKVNLTKHELGIGLFYVEIISENKKERLKLIIQ